MLKTYRISRKYKTFLKNLITKISTKKSSKKSLNIKKFNKSLKTNGCRSNSNKMVVKTTMKIIY